MRIAIGFFALALGLIAVGCGAQKDTPYSGPELTPLTGKKVPAGYGAPGEDPLGKPTAAPKVKP